MITVNVAVVGVGVGVTVGVGVGVGVTVGVVGVTISVLCTFLLWSENPVTELSLPLVCVPKSEFLHRSDL